MFKICAYLDGGRRTSVRSYRERHSVLAAASVPEDVLQSLRDHGLFDEDQWPESDTQPPPVDSVDTLMDWLSDMEGDTSVDINIYSELKRVADEAASTGVGLVVLMKGHA